MQTFKTDRELELESLWERLDRRLSSLRVLAFKLQQAGKGVAAIDADMRADHVQAQRDRTAVLLGWIS